MALVLNTVTQAAVPETSNSQGTDEFSLAAGKNLKIETFPDGDEILNMEVPEGKAWVVIVDIAIKETDA